MTTITIPSSPNPQAMAWKLVMPAQNNISAWTGSHQVMASNRGWWECQITYPPIVGSANFREWAAFIAKMRGAANNVQIPVDQTAQSALANTMSVNGAGQTGRSLIVDGMPNSSTVLYAGQYVTVGDQLLQLTADVTTNGTGQATLSFEPPVRSAPADNATVEYKNPYCLMYFTSDPGHYVEPGYVYTISFELRESF